MGGRVRGGGFCSRCSTSRSARGTITLAAGERIELPCPIVLVFEGDETDDPFAWTLATPQGRSSSRPPSRSARTGCRQAAPPSPPSPEAQVSARRRAVVPAATMTTSSSGPRAKATAAPAATPASRGWRAEPLPVGRRAGDHERGQQRRQRRLERPFQPRRAAVAEPERDRGAHEHAQARQQPDREPAHRRTPTAAAASPAARIGRPGGSSGVSASATGAPSTARRRGDRATATRTAPGRRRRVRGAPDRRAGCRPARR